MTTTSRSDASPPGLSLWIGPPEDSPLAATLEDIVNHYSTELGTPKCVMAKVEETKDLLSLNTHLRTLFPRDEEPYWPHLSLVYGDLSDKVKTRIRDEIRANKAWDVVGSDVFVDRIEVWNTQGQVPTWTKVGMVELE
ncbi:hypothetical protein HDV05_002032 [Chytridiales sp. JEL 0842]|nr:hypothetical protein HDV05_002032 [Chytridiales sp. JEL 0842]